MNSSHEHYQEFKWVSGGIAGLIIAGMVLIGVIYFASDGDPSPTITILVGMLTAGVGQLAGLMQTSRKVDENTAKTEQTVKQLDRIDTRLNGDLDRRMQETAQAAIANALPDIQAATKQAMQEALDEYTLPRHL